MNKNASHFAEMYHKNSDNIFRLKDINVSFRFVFFPICEKISQSTSHLSSLTVTVRKEKKKR